MGGKNSTSTSMVQVPPEVLARYNAVNARAEGVASRPFQVYSTSPDAFVAGLNESQWRGINQTENAATMAQPYYQSGINATNQAMNTGLGYVGTANTDLSGAQSAANPLQGSAAQDYTQAFQSSQPYNAAATNYAVAGGQAVNPDALNVGQYLSPYLSTVLGSTSALINQNNQQQMQGQLGNAIRQGAFGGDRGGIAAANLAQQQALGAGQIYSNILNQGWNTALGTAQQQQGVQLGASQANRAALQQTAAALQGLGQQNYTQGMGLGAAQQGLAAQLFGQGLQTSQQRAALGQEAYGIGSGAGRQIADLGAGAQSAALQGAQAELAAGQIEQQTRQAGLTALYNQFLQQQSYPFQVSQFLANIAEGTGALSGSTTTTTQPGGLFSDRHLKDDIEPIGETYDGQKIVKFRYKGDPTARIGLIAQDVEKRHPDAVGLAGGYRTVDYDKATEDAAKRGHFRSGGLAAANDNRSAHADGGLATGTDGPSFADILAAQARMYAPFQGGGLYGSSAAAAPMGGSSYVPSANLPVRDLAVSKADVQRPKTPVEQANDVANLATSLQKGLGSKPGKAIVHGLKGAFKSPSSDLPSGGLDAGAPSVEDYGGEPMPFAHGGLARGHFASGGDPYEDRYGPGLTIPDEAPKNLKLETPDVQGKPHSTLGDIASIGNTVAKVLPFIGLARGGVADESALDFPAVGDEEGEDEQSAILKLAKSLLSGRPEEDEEVRAPPGVSGEAARIAAPAAAQMEAAPSGSRELTGLPSDLNHTLKLIAKVEGAGKNPKSSAKGLYQITDPTFVGAYRQMFPEESEGMSKADILALRDTPEGDKLSAMMGPWLARQNIDRLQKAGLQPSASNIYLAHFLGPSGAVKVLQADPETPLDKLVSPLAIAENRPIMAGRTAGDLQSWAADRLQQANRSAYRLGGRARKADGGELDDKAPAAEDFASDAQTTQALQPEHHPGLWDNLKKPEVFIPILSGLATMATAPTQHFGTALAAGIGAGAQAYQKQREFQLEQLQRQSQAGLMGAEAAALGLKPQELSIRQYEANTQRLQAQMQALSQAQQLFDANYSQLATPGPDGFPMWMNRLTGEKLSNTQYSNARSRYLQGALSGIGEGLGPLKAAESLPPGPGEPNGSGVGGVDGRNGGVAGPGVGARADAGRTVAPGGGAAGPGTGAGVPAVPVPQGRRAAPVSSRGTLEQKLASGEYLHPAVSLPDVDNGQIADNSNPAVLMQQGRELQQNATNPEVRAQGEAMIARAQRIMGGQEIPLGKDGQPYMGYVRLAQARDAAGHVTQSYAQQIEQQNEGASRFAEQFPQSMQILNSLRRIYSETDVNRLSGEWADLVGKIRSVPWLKDKLEPQLKAYQDAVDEAHKDAARQQIVAAVSAEMANKAPAAALHVTGMTVPNPSMGAGARYNLVAQLYAQQQLGKDFYRDWSRNKDRVMDVSSYVSDWTNEHPISAYEKWAYDHIAPFPGMTQQEMLQHPRRPKSPEDLKGLPKGVPFVIPSGPNAGKIGWTQ